jgi:hypothetical protein
MESGKNCCSTQENPVVVVEVVQTREEGMV